MASTYKVLGQVAPTSPSFDYDLYTVPSATQTVASTLTVCNRGSSTSFRVAVRPAGATIANEHYIIYDAFINSYDTLFFTLGISLNATDVVTVQVNSPVISFSLFGAEIA
jgi:hypothetical protein